MPIKVRTQVAPLEEACEEEDFDVVLEEAHEEEDFAAALEVACEESLEDVEGSDQAVEGQCLGDKI